LHHGQSNTCWASLTPVALSVVTQLADERFDEERKLLVQQTHGQGRLAAGVCIHANTHSRKVQSGLQQASQPANHTSLPASPVPDKEHSDVIPATPRRAAVLRHYPRPEPLGTHTRAPQWREKHTLDRPTAPQQGSVYTGASTALARTARRCTRRCGSDKAGAGQRMAHAPWKIGDQLRSASQSAAG